MLSVRGTELMLLVTILAIQIHSIAASGGSCNLNITIESDSSIRIEFDAVKDAIHYSVSVVPRHDIWTVGFNLNTHETTVQISCLLSDTLYDVSVEAVGAHWTAGNCTAHTYPAPIQVIVGQKPTPHSALLFVGPNPRVTQWRMELNYINGTGVRKWNTIANTFYGFSVTGLIPNTRYSVRAKPSQIHGSAADRTEFGDWTHFSTGMLSVFGRVSVVDETYEETNIKMTIEDASLIKGSFSDLSIIGITKDTGSATVDYEINVYESSFASIPNFTISSERLNHSRINAGETANAAIIWYVDSTRHELITTLDPECNKAPRCAIMIIRNTEENGMLRIFNESGLQAEQTSVTELWSFYLEQIDELPGTTNILSDNMDYNTLNVVSVTPLLEDRAIDLPYTRIYQTVYNSSDEYYFFTKDINPSNVPISSFKYTLGENCDYVILILPNVKKSVKYEITGIYGTLFTLSQADIDGSEYLQIPLDNLTANRTYDLKVNITAKNHDGEYRSVAVSFNISTSFMACNATGTNEICYKNSIGDVFSDCNIGYKRNESMICSTSKCSSCPCEGNTTCWETNSTEYPGFQCICNIGFTGHGTECLDIDECAAGTDNCAENATCDNTDGSYECFCNNGYSGDGFECVDNKECELGTHNCTENATCINTDGSYECFCNNGYSGDGFECVDNKECELGTHNCTENATCINTDGSYECFCNNGYSGDGFDCVDIDECGEGTDNCNENVTCINTDGSYMCNCNIGYIGNLTHCFENPLDYNSMIPNATTWKLITTWSTSSSLEISLSNSTSIHSIDACQDIDGMIPSAIPIQVHSTNSSVHVMWNKTYRGIIFSIAVSGENSVPLQEVNTMGSSYKLTDLKPGNTLKLCMRILHCAIPPGNFACRTVYTVPSHVEKVRVFPTFDSITAFWSPVKGSQKYIASLAAMINRRMGSGNNFIVYKETTGTNLTFESLKPATEYIFSIAAANDAGNGAYVEERVTTYATTPEMTFQWWWVVTGFVLLLFLVIGLITAHVYLNHWYAKLDVTKRNELNSSRCFSCWSAILMVQEADMNDRMVNDDLEENGVKLRWFPWRRLFNVSAKQRCNKVKDHRDENPYDMARDNQQR